MKRVGRSWCSERLVWFAVGLKVEVATKDRIGRVGLGLIGGVDLIGCNERLVLIMVTK